MLYCHIDDIERLQKVVADTEEQFANCLRQIKTLGEEKGQREKELEILREATQTLMDMVDPAEEGKADKQPLLERLRGAPERVVKFLTEAPITCVSHAFTFVKSFWPEACGNVHAGSGCGVH
jgi:chromosome segregation ATPase